MPLRLDHLVVVAPDLATGEAWAASRLGVAAAGHGRHETMGTHNALWGLGDSYLEVIAVDPAGRVPDRPRWFGLDDPAMAARLAAGPFLATWAVAVDDLPALAAHAPVALEPARRLSRDDLGWEVALPLGAELPLGGAWPLAIRWLTGLHPARRLGRQGLGLRELTIAGAGAARAETALRAAGFDPVAGAVRFEPGAGPTRLSALLGTPGGTVEL